MWGNRDRPSYFSGYWVRPFIDLNYKRISIPAKRTWTHAQKVGVLIKRVFASFGHCPSFHTFPVKTDIKCHMIFGITPSGPSIIRGEHRPYHGNDRETEEAVIADCIRIPPSVTSAWNSQIKTWSFRICSAASIPESVAIGTPAPGCTLPPARYNPGIRVFAPGRANEAVHP